MRSIHSRLFISAAATAALAAPSLAHHGWAGQGADLVDVRGTVHKVVSPFNPHSSMQVMAEGQVWEVTLPASSRTEGAGLTAKTFAVGDPVTVRGNRNADAKRLEIKAVRVSAGSRNFDLYPERMR